MLEAILELKPFSENRNKNLLAFTLVGDVHDLRYELVL